MSPAPGGSARPKVKIKHRDVHHDDGEGNWLISYADLMTLLFGFFVILTSFSSPSASKFEKLQESTAKAMKVKHTKPYAELTDSLKKVLVEMKLDGEVDVVQTAVGVDLIMKGNLFFDSGVAVLNPKANEILQKMAPVITKEAKGFRIVVEGHTDDVPIVTSLYPSNWELSSARAGTVVRILESLGFSHLDLRPVGLGDIEPVAPNENPDGTANIEGRAKNRRILIRIQRMLPSRLHDEHE